MANPPARANEAQGTIPKPIIGEFGDMDMPSIFEQDRRNACAEGP